MKLFMSQIIFLFAIKLWTECVVTLILKIGELFLFFSFHHLEQLTLLCLIPMELILAWYYFYIHCSLAISSQWNYWSVPPQMYQAFSPLRRGWTKIWRSLCIRFENNTKSLEEYGTQIDHIWKSLNRIFSSNLLHLHHLHITPMLPPFYHNNSQCASNCCCQLSHFQCHRYTTTLFYNIPASWLTHDSQGIKMEVHDYNGLIARRCSLIVSPL